MHADERVDEPWRAALREACQSQTQAAVATRLGYSTGVISAVLSHKYGGGFGGNLERVQQAIEGTLMGASVECPVIGDMPRQRCIEHQRRAGKCKATSPMRVALSKACPTCANRTALASSSSAGVPAPAAPSAGIAPAAFSTANAGRASKEAS